MKRLAGLAAALILALGGCSAIDWHVPATAPRGAAADDLVGYLAQLRGMNAARLTAEAARQRKAATPGAAGDIARVKAALALTLSEPSDDAQITALLEPVLTRAGADPGIAGMANFLQQIVVERHRLRESATSAGTRLRDEHRALEQQRQRADAFQDRATELQKKLDALSELEKSLTDRQSPSH